MQVDQILCSDFVFKTKTSMHANAGPAWFLLGSADLMCFTWGRNPVGEATEVEQIIIFRLVPW